MKRLACFLAICSTVTFSPHATAEPAGKNSTPPVAAAAIGSANIAALFGTRVMPILSNGKPLFIGEFNGDGWVDALYPVRILAAAGKRAIAADVTISNPWDDTAIDKNGADFALAIVSGKDGRKFLLHDAGFFDTPIWKGNDYPISLAKKGSVQHRDFRRQEKKIRNDIVVLFTEAGIDIALYWNGTKFDVFWPDEQP